jgi:hypothetical protein
VLSLIALDQLLHPDGVPLPVPVAQDRVGSAARLNQHIGQDRAGVDIHRGDVCHMYRLFLLSDPAGLVLHDAGRGDSDLRRKEAVAAADAAGAIHIARHERAAFSPRPPDDEDDDCRACCEYPPQPVVFASHQTLMLS